MAGQWRGSRRDARHSRERGRTSYPIARSIQLAASAAWDRSGLCLASLGVVGAWAQPWCGVLVAGRPRGKQSGWRRPGKGASCAIDGEGEERSDEGDVNTSHATAYDRDEQPERWGVLASRGGRDWLVSTARLCIRK